MPRWWVANAQQAARDVIEAQRTGNVDEDSGPGSSGYSTADDVLAALPRQYELRTQLLDKQMLDAYTPLSLDGATREWLAAAAPAWWRGLFVPPLQWLGFNGPDIDALLGTGKMHVLSADHCRQLVGPWLLRPRGAPVGGAAADSAAEPRPLQLLDIGAGSGEVTQALVAALQYMPGAGQSTSGAAAPVSPPTPPLQVQTTATDTSAACVRALQAKGFHGIQCHSVDASQTSFATDGQFDVVACLNVLDRCAAPAQLLQDAVRLCAPGGVLMFALVLPWDDFYEEGGVQKQPATPLPMDGYRCGDGPGLEVCLGGFLRNVLGVLSSPADTSPLIPEGVLTLRSVSRVPYLAEGDLFASTYWLPNAVVVCSKNAAETA